MARYVHVPPGGETELVIGRLQRVVLDWPDPRHPQQFHLDVEVIDLADATRQAIALRAALLRADDRDWRVRVDPADHPFCLLHSHA